MKSAAMKRRKRKQPGRHLPGMIENQTLFRQKGVKLRYTEPESCVSVNIVPSERMVSSSSIDFLPVSSIGL